MGYGVFDAFVSGELRAAAAGLLDIVVDLDAQVSTEVFLSDSSSRCFALLSGRFDRELVAEAVGVRERWKFNAPSLLFADEPTEDTELPARSAQASAGQGAFDDWACSQVSDRELAKLERQRTARTFGPAVRSLAALEPLSGSDQLMSTMRETEPTLHVVFGTDAVPPACRVLC